MYKKVCYSTIYKHSIDKTSIDKNKKVKYRMGKFMTE